MSTQASSDNDPETNLQEGALAFAQGDLKKALALFNDAETGFGKKGELHGRCDALIRSAHVGLAMGRVDMADASLKEAEQIAMTLEDTEQIGRVCALQGNVLHVAGNTEASREKMEKAISIAEKHGYTSLAVSVHNDLGNLFGSLMQYSKALGEYRASAEIARKIGHALRSSVALSNGAMVCIKSSDQYAPSRNSHQTAPGSMDGVSAIREDGDGRRQSGRQRDVLRTRGTILIMEDNAPDIFAVGRQTALLAEAAVLLDEASASLPDAEISQHKATTHINIGLSYIDLAERLPEQAPSYRKKAAREFALALEDAQGIENSRLASYALGNLGRLREAEGKFDLASESTMEAIYRAAKADAPESLYRWQWQYARILTAQNRLLDAIAAFQSAIFTMESIRAEFANCYGKPRADLRKSESELYLMYVDVLLRHAAGLNDSEKQGILKTARQTVEKRKLFELRNYFNDDCLGESAMELASVDELVENAVVVYPVILSDRLEVIVTFPSDADESLDAGRKSGAQSACKLYTTFVDSTAVAKTAGDFREMLMARTSDPVFFEHSKKLYDWLVRPLERDLARSKPDTLVFVPDSALRNIPMGALHDGSSFLIQSYAIAVTPGLALANPTPLTPDRINVLAVGITSASKGFAALPGVAEELQAISSLYPCKALVDSQFSLAGFEAALKNEIYNVVHIASHGKFDDHIEDSFILASDRPMTFNELSDFIGLYRYRERPLELLTLSACETAAGNEEAALGLAGIAVKVGARSVLATLWAIDDLATAQLISEFYRQLRQSGVSRATALRQAKLKLLAGPSYSHPGYWSPFVLINNWL